MTDHSLRKAARPSTTRGSSTSLSSSPWTASKKRSRPQSSSQLAAKKAKSSSSPDTAAKNESKDSTDLSTDPNPVPKTSSPATHITIRETIGDLFACPPNSLLLHACNTEGTWGAGIAAAFKKSYPSAFTVYTAHCKKWSSSLLGSCLLIPPQTSSSSKSECEAGHWIGCLFTSVKKGKGKGSVESILEATGDAVGDLCRKLGEQGEGEMGEVRMPKINSGLFRVPWRETVGVIEGLQIEEGGWIGEIIVVSLD